jgi:hypothetical protein
MTATTLRNELQNARTYVWTNELFDEIGLYELISTFIIHNINTNSISRVFKAIAAITEN